MTTTQNQVIIHLPVKNVKKSKDFYILLGLTFNTELSDENAACFSVNEHTLIALLRKSHFKEVLQSSSADKSAVLLAVGMESKDQVDEFVNKAIDLGRPEIRKAEDHGWLYGRSFSDPDLHQWNIFYMDLSKKPR